MILPDANLTIESVSLLTKTFTQTFGLARFPNNAYEAMKLTKVFNFKKTLKKAIIEKYQ
jgi:hypothetical protein